MLLHQPFYTLYQTINEIGTLPPGPYSSLGRVCITRSTSFHFQQGRHIPSLLWGRRAVWLHNTISGAVGAPTIPYHAAGERLQLSAAGR